MYYYSLRVAALAAPDGTRTHALHREWLASEALDCVEIQSDGPANPSSPSGGHGAQEKVQTGAGKPEKTHDRHRKSEKARPPI